MNRFDSTTAYNPSAAPGASCWEPVAIADLLNADSRELSICNGLPGQGMHVWWYGTVAAWDWAQGASDLRQGDYCQVDTVDQAQAEQDAGYRYGLAGYSSKWLGQGVTAMAQAEGVSEPFAAGWMGGFWKSPGDKGGSRYGTEHGAMCLIHGYAQQGGYFTAVSGDRPHQLIVSEPDRDSTGAYRYDYMGGGVYCYA